MIKDRDSIFDKNQYSFLIAGSSARFVCNYTRVADSDRLFTQYTSIWANVPAPVAVETRDSDDKVGVNLDLYLPAERYVHVVIVGHIVMRVYTAGHWREA